MFSNYGEAVWSSSSVLNTSTDASWNTGTSRLTFASAGLYEIVMTYQLVNDNPILQGADFDIGAISTLATGGQLSAGSDHPFSAGTNGAWATDVFYHQASSGETIDVVMRASSFSGTGPTGLNVTAQMAVRKLS